MQPILVLGGGFSIAGTVSANCIAAYDPLTGGWSALGAGMSGPSQSWVLALAVLPNGDLVAGGEFTTAGGVSANNIARWNGTSWSALGSGLNGWVNALTTMPNGDLVAGGFFTTAGGVTANSIARWDGTSWSALGSGMSGGQLGPSVLALAVLPNGDLVAGGAFSLAGGVSARYIARWNGTSWSALGAGMVALQPSVAALAVLPNGDLVAGGVFTTAGGVSANNISRWNGTSWSGLGSGMNARVHSLTTLPNGDLAAGGQFTTAGGVSANCIARWNGTGWSALGSGVFLPSPQPSVWGVRALAVLPNADLVAGGDFTTAGGVSAPYIARWNGASWSMLGSGMDAPVRALTTLPNGDLVAGGHFTTAGGVSANNIARWDGTSWSPLGSGMSLPPIPPYNPLPSVTALAVLPDGNLVAGGRFTSAGGVSANYIARWNGTSWSALGSGMNGGVDAVTILPNGDLVAGGWFTTAGGVSANGIARWDGTSWSALGSGINGFVYALTILPNGDLVAGGQFTTAGGVSANGIARWNGTSWLALGSGMYLPPLGLPPVPQSPSVLALAVLPNGDLVAGGHFSAAGGVGANYIARWNGTSWSALGSGTNASVYALTMLPNGDLAVGGGWPTVGDIVRWNGTSWSALGPGMNSIVYALTMLPNGDLVAGGNFSVVNGAVSRYLAQLTTTCPATAVSYGAGCTGSGGPNVLAATSLPWVGSTFRSVATGMPAPALALGVFGFSAISVPMPSILPQGVPGCTLLVSPDLLEVYVPGSGIVQTQLVIPNTVALAGVVLRAQVVPIEFSGTGSITALTGTNALTLTIGSF